MLRVEARAVDAEARRADAIAARDAALEEEHRAKTVADQARASVAVHLHEQLDALNRRLDTFERVSARAQLDAQPDPDNPDAGGELHPHGPVDRAHLTAGD